MCDYFEDGICLIATEVAGFACKTNTQSCAACKKHDAPQQHNIVTHGLASAALIKAGQLSEAARIARQAVWDQSTRTPGKFGPGDALHHALGRIGFRITPNCSCRKHIQRMNNNGIDWCLQNTHTITEWLKAEAKRRGLGLLFFRAGVEIFVKRILHAHRKKETKGANTDVRNL